MRRFLLSTACLFAAANVYGGDLKMQFVFDGDVPAPAPIDVNRDTAFCGKHDLTDESLVVNPKNKGIKNVVVYVYTGRGGSDLPDSPEKNDTHELANEDCRFEPRVVLTQVGDTLKVTNPDPVGHNANLNFLKNDAKNLMIPASQEKDVELEESEPAPIPVECNIHPWMRAYVVVLDHPYAAVSDEDGNLTIKGLPNEELTFRVWMEAADGALSEVEVDGKTQEWKRNRFEVDIKDGVNDLGVVKIKPDQVKLP
nr:methylamine utilization protein [Roseimaritima sediminicola]